MPRKPKLPATIREEQRLQRLERIALAAWEMENDLYNFPPGTCPGKKLEDGKRAWNKSELLRLYGHKTDGHWEIFQDPHFIRMVEYHRWRSSDPMFRKKVQNQIWAEIADELSLQVYEKVKFHPDQLTYNDKLKTLKLILDAGVKLRSQDAKNRSNELLAGMDPDERKALVEEQVKHAERALADLKSMNAALDAADYIEGEADE